MTESFTREDLSVEDLNLLKTLVKAEYIWVKRLDTSLMIVPTQGLTYRTTSTRNDVDPQSKGFLGILN